MRHIPRPLAGLFAATLLLAACGTVDPTSEATTSAPAESANTSPTGDDRHAGHAEHGHDAATDETQSTTEQTLAQLRAMDPTVLASLHDHGEHGQHGQHNERAVSHPNGVEPVRIVIPSLGVDADVVKLGLDDNGRMEVPSNFDNTGWFQHGPRPGRVGPAVIAGHVDDRDGPAVFFHLAELRPGDEIQIHGIDGEVVTFAVRELEQHPKGDFPTERVYAGTPGPELRLITCGGEFDEARGSYRDNVIVYAERTDH